MFAALAALFANRTRIVRQAAEDIDWARSAVIAAFTVLAVFILLAGYFLFLRAFGTMLGDPLSGMLVTRYVLETAFAVIFFLGAASFIISSISFIFRAGEIKLLAAMPVEPLAIFAYRFAGAVAMAGWPVFFIGVPALAALGSVLGAPPEYYFFCLFLLALFSLLIAAAGGLASFLLAWIGRRVPAGWLWLGETVAAVLALFALVHQLLPRSLFLMFFTASPAEAARAQAQIDRMFSFSPGHPFVQIIASLLPGGAGGRTGLTVLWLTVVIAAAVVLLLELARRYFLPLWQGFEEGGFLARPEDAPAARPRRSFPRVFLWKYGFLFEKDMLSFVRDAGELSRAGFLLLLLLLYVLVMRGLAAMGVMGQPEMQSWVLALAFAAIGYFGLTMCLRFVFPSLSLEGRSAWVIWSSPLHIHEVFSWKLFFWSTAIAAPLLLATGLTASLFGLAPPLALFFLFAVLCAAVTLVALALGQGCLFPNFRDRDPDTLATSPAGLAATGLGLGYLWIVVRYVRSFTLVFLASGTVDVKSAFGILIVSWGLITAYWLAAPRRMDRLEFPS